jgi:hypothetical protein
MFVCVVALLLAFVVRGADAPSTVSGDKPADPPAKKTWEPTEAYDVRQVRGWTVRVNKQFAADDAALCGRVMELLDVHLLQVERTVPAKAVEKLKGVVIWVERESPPHPGMVYHPDAGWLRRNGINPDKARCVEIANARNFIDWWHTQPWMVLHEMAHAYHHQFLPGGFGNADVKAAYQRAKQAKLYDNVQYIGGKDQKAYAMNDPMEFFAEGSEALFGTNDFYPFVRSELKKHDPETWEMLRKAWGVGEK